MSEHEQRLKQALAKMAARAEASAARIAELEVERERSGEWVSAWHNLDRVMVEFGMDKKAQPQEAEVWLRGRLLRIAELERELAARPVVESPKARRLRETVESLHAAERAVIDDPWKLTSESDQWFDFRRAVHDFCASAPPASAPSGDRDMYANVKENRDELLAMLERVIPRHVLERDGTVRGMESWLRSQLEAPKVAPARVEREVDAELRDALRSSASWEQPSERVLAALDRWLAAPMSPAPAQDEYTKAAVEYAEARIVLDQNKISFYDATCDKAFQSYRALYAAGKRGEASAFRSRPPPADALAPFPDGPAVPPMAVCGGTNFNPPAPADERVTLYIPEFQRGMSGLVYSSSERSRVVDVKRWLAIDARVVREGGAA